MDSFKRDVGVWKALGKFIDILDAFYDLLKIFIASFETIYEVILKTFTWLHLNSSHFILIFQNTAHTLFQKNL